MMIFCHQFIPAGKANSSSAIYTKAKKTKDDNVIKYQNNASH